MKTFRHICLIMFAAIAAASCLGGSNGDSYSNLPLYDFGVFSGNTFTTDAGATFTLTNDASDGKWTSGKRYYIYYTVTSESGKETIITLQDYVETIVKNALVASEVSESDYGSDPVLCRDTFVSGAGATRYLNIYAVVSYLKSTGPAGHKIDLLYDDTKSSKSGMYMTLKHDGAGEVFGAEGVNDDDIEFGGVYYSFPLLPIIPADAGKTIYMEVGYTWYLSNGNSFIKDTVDGTVSGTISVGSTIATPAED